MLSIGWIGLGLGSTWIRPNLIGWSSHQLVVDQETDWVGWVKPPTSGRQVSWSQRFEKIAKHLWHLARTNWNLIRSTWYLTRNLDIFALESGNFHREIFERWSVQVFGFWWRKTKTNLPKLVSWGKDLLLIVGVVESDGVGLDPVDFFGWVGSSEFRWVGQP